MLLNLLGKESCFCIIHSYMYQLVSRSEVIEGACNYLDTEMKACPKGLAFDSFYIAHGQMWADLRKGATSH